jgi:serine protease Do
MTTARRAAALVGSALLLAAQARANPPEAPPASGPRGRAEVAPSPAAGVPRAWLGVSVMGLEREAEDASVGDAVGVTVTKVADGGPAALAGLAPGDVIISIDGRMASSPADISTYVGTRRAGQKAQVVLLRDGEPRAVAVTLAPRPETEPATKRVLRVVDSPTPPATMEDHALLRYAGDAERACLGVECLDLTPGLARYFGAPESEGILVDRVDGSSAASDAGIRAGDVVLRLDEAPIASVTGFADRLRTMEPRARLKVTLLRDGSRLNVTAMLRSCKVPVWVYEQTAAFPPLGPPAASPAPPAARAKP